MGNPNKKSLDLPFLYNVYRQTDFKKGANAHGHYTIFSQLCNSALPYNEKTAYSPIQKVLDVCISNWLIAKRKHREHIHVHC